MLTVVVVAGTAAVAAIFGQFFSSLNAEREHNNSISVKHESPFAEIFSNSSAISSDTFSALPDVDKQIDAFFVSHGRPEEKEETKMDASGENFDIREQEERDPQEQEQKQEQENPENHFKEQPIQIPKEKDMHDLSEVSQIKSGENWLILSYVPWCPMSMAMLEHFKSQYAQVRNENLNLAIVDVDAHPEMVYHLQIREYPSLTLITEDLRIRPWPFASRKMGTDILGFLEHSKWRYIPVFQRLNTAAVHPFYVKQLRVFNEVAKKLTLLQPRMISFIQEHRQITGTTLAALGTAVILAKTLFLK